MEIESSLVAQGAEDRENGEWLLIVSFLGDEMF